MLDFSALQVGGVARKFLNFGGGLNLRQFVLTIA
jgi:hypothetical protein